jgi:hypothetical protein
MNHLAVTLVLMLASGLQATSAQFGSTTCTGGCVRPITHWKNSLTVWPAAYPNTTTICGTQVSVILDAYNYVDCGTVTPISILGQLIWAKANEASGACRTTTAQNAINNLQNAVNAANAGEKSFNPYYATNPNTSPVTGGCDGGWTFLEAALKRSSISVSLSGTLCKFNAGDKWGPCPCDAAGEVTVCQRL